MGLIFISPWLVHFFVFQLWLFAFSFWLSLHAVSMLKEPIFLGVDNYIELITGDPRFRNALYNTIYYAISAVGFGTVVSILMALLLHMKVKGKASYRTLYYLPSVTPAVAAEVVFLCLLNPQFFGLLVTFI